MPVNAACHDKSLYQRELYNRSRITRSYWGYRDKVALSFIGREDRVIIDIGCGEGITLDHVKSLYPDKRIIGVDRILENLFICRKYRNEAVGGDVFHLPFKDNSFDCALLIEVIEHISDPDPVVSEIRRILKPEAKLILIFPNDFIFKIARVLALKFKEAWFDSGHVRQWQPKDIRGLLERKGFSVIRGGSIPFYFWHLSLHHFVVCKKVN